MAPLATAEAPIALGLNPKLASALTDPLRGQILAELDDRPLSPSEFTREAGGGDIAQVSRCFRHLERCGYAEVVEERPGKRRGRSVEHVYRLTPNRHTDTWAWPDDPRVEQAFSSFPAFEAFFSRIIEAGNAETLDQEIDRHLSWDIRALDERARTQLLERIDRVGAWLPRLERDVARRAREATREVIPTTVGLFAFPSPQSPEEVLCRPRGTAIKKDDSRFSLSPEVANAMGNRWRARILVELLTSPLSPSQFVGRVGGDPSYVARCFRELAEWGLVELIETRTGGRRRGAVERVYRNARALHIHISAWRTMPQVMRVEVSSVLLAGYVDRLDEAVLASAMGIESEPRLAWERCVFDRLAWREVNRELDRILYSVPRLERESVDRVGSQRDRLLPTALGLACFRSPPG